MDKVYVPILCEVVDGKVTRRETCWEIQEERPERAAQKLLDSEERRWDAHLVRIGTPFACEVLECEVTQDPHPHPPAFYQPDDTWLRAVRQFKVTLALIATVEVRP